MTCYLAVADCVEKLLQQGGRIRSGLHLIRDDVAPHDHLVEAVLRRLELHSDIQEQLFRHPGELILQVHRQVDPQPRLQPPSCA